MSILIKGAEIPKGDVGLVLIIFKDGTVYSPGTLTKSLVREKNVEAVPVPTPHGRLIDADSLMENTQLTDAYGNTYGVMNGVSCEAILNYPTIIEAEE